MQGIAVNFEWILYSLPIQLLVLRDILNLVLLNNWLINVISRHVYILHNLLINLLLSTFLFVCYKIHFLRGMNCCAEILRLFKFYYLLFFSGLRFILFTKYVVRYFVRLCLPCNFRFDCVMTGMFCVCAELQWVSISSFGDIKKIVLVFGWFLSGRYMNLFWIIFEKYCYSP